MAAQRMKRMDYRSRRFRTGLLLGTAFVAGLAVGPAAGLIGRHSGSDFGISAAFAQDGSSRADTYRLLTLFGDVFERVRAEYVDPVTDKDLVENAINGMLTGLDPHSSYMNAKAVPRHAGADQGRVRRPRHRGHPGQRLHQGDQPDRRHAGVQGRHQGGRHHHRARRQDRAGPVAATTRWTRCAARRTRRSR